VCLLDTGTRETARPLIQIGGKSKIITCYHNISVLKLFTAPVYFAKIFGNKNHHRQNKLIPPSQPKIIGTGFNFTNYQF
jgi:hypothetical protein